MPYLIRVQHDGRGETRGGSPPITANRLLARLHAFERERLNPVLDLVRLEKGRVLAEAGDPVKSVHFLVSGVVSLMATTEEDEAVEISMVGRDGFVGVPVALREDRYPYRIVVQATAQAFRMRSDRFVAELRQNRTLEDAVLQYAYTVLLEMTRSAVCNRYHTVRQRLCRWLLVMQDLGGSSTIALTQEFIAQMLGVERNTVSTAMLDLQKEGYVRQWHGRSEILSRSGLEEWACPCYGVVEGEKRRHVREQPSSRATAQDSSRR